MYRDRADKESMYEERGEREERNSSIVLRTSNLDEGDGTGGGNLSG
ncbi:hypothetical protein [Desulfosporosinus youngiae]|nr:hypothetical protein [Desulfosporosinus youngiae]